VFFFFFSSSFSFARVRGFISLEKLQESTSREWKNDQRCGFGIDRYLNLRNLTMTRSIIKGIGGANPALREYAIRILRFA